MEFGHGKVFRLQRWGLTVERAWLAGKYVRGLLALPTNCGEGDVLPFSLSGGREVASFGVNLQEIRNGALEGVGEFLEVVEGGGGIALFPISVGTLLGFHPSGHFRLGKAVPFAEGVQQSRKVQVAHGNRSGW